MSDYKMVPMVATEDMRDAGWGGSFRIGCAEWGQLADKHYAAMLAKAPPFVVTDEVLEAAGNAARESRLFLGKYGRTEYRPPETDEDWAVIARAAIETVLGGGV